MSATLLTLAWSLIMSAPPTPPLTDAQKKAEYELVSVEEKLTPEQIRQRDIIPGWRPRPPLSDIERAAVEIVRGEDNPYLVRGTWRLASKGLTHDDLDSLGAPSPSPRGFALRTGARQAWWYEQIDDKGRMTGIWLALYKSGPTVEGWVMVGRLFMGPGVFDDVEPGIRAGTEAMRALKKRLGSSPSVEAAGR